MWSSWILAPEEPKDTVFTTRSRRPGIKICPRCGSIDVDATTGTGYVSPPLYVCNRCNFSGSIFPEVEDVEALKGLKKSPESEGQETDVDEESKPADGEEETDEENMD